MKSRERKRLEKMIALKDELISMKYGSPLSYFEQEIIKNLTDRINESKTKVLNEDNYK